MIATQTRNGVAVITLNRPERRNAMVPEMVAELGQQVRAVGRAEATQAIVLTGAGPAFCVGADLKWLAGCADPAEAVATLVAAHHAVIRALREAPVPIVAAVNGVAAGGGMSLALAADYRVAALGASFVAAYSRLGLPPDGGTSAFLVRAVGVARAMELLLSNRPLAAGEARAWGLVGEVVPSGALLDRACTVAAAVAHVRGETLLTIRRLLDTATAQPLEAQLDLEEEAMRAAAASGTFKEALLRFLEKRP
jgi:2-(1,2-epoxy-1,2-dihydrophenyl)acetyl-CoA isomerase